MTQIASRPLYVWWTVSYLWMFLFLGLITSAVCFEGFRSIEAKGLLFCGLFAVAALPIIGFGYRYWQNLAHTVLLENGSFIRLISWQKSQSIPITASLCIRQKSFGRIIVIFLENDGKVLGKYFPPLNRYREIRAHGAGHYWKGILEHHMAFET